MKADIKIGTCGFQMTKEEYALNFSAVEVQQTFYQPPQIKTLEKWRELVPADFEFTLKAWQLITHEVKSPTYRRLKRKLSEKEITEAGYFKPTEIVREAWETTLQCAEALKAKMGSLLQKVKMFHRLFDNNLILIKLTSVRDKD